MSDIAQTAADLIGKQTGTWDCSGFTQHCYSVHGKSIPRTSSTRADIRPGTDFTQ